MRKLSIIFLCAFLAISCAGNDTVESENLPNRLIKPAEVDSVDVEQFSHGDSLRVTVAGHLSDSCTSLYEEEIKVFKNPGVIDIVIPTVRPKNRYCTQVLREFEHTFKFDFDSSKDMPVILVNGFHY